MSLLQRMAQKDLGTTEVTLYTVPEAKSAVLIGANISNNLDTSIRVDFVIQSTGDVKYYIVKGLIIPSHSAFSFSGLEQKLVLSAGDSVVVKSNTDRSGDVWMSFSELEG